MKSHGVVITRAIFSQIYIYHKSGKLTTVENEEIAL